MPDHDFELQASRLFAEPAAHFDDAAFAERVEARIERYLAVRQLVMAAVCGLGALAGALILLRSTLINDLARIGSGLFGSVEALSVSPDPILWQWPAAAVVLAAVSLAAARATRAI